MTDKNTAKTVVAETVETKRRGRKPLDPATLTTTEPNALHKGMAEWLTQTSGVEVTPKSVQVVLALQSQFRRSDAGAQAAKAREAAKTERAQIKRAERIAAAEKRLAALKAGEAVKGK